MKGACLIPVCSDVVDFAIVWPANARTAAGSSFSNGSPAAGEQAHFGIIPNNRTSPSLINYKPISTKEKFEIARQDSLDRGTVILAAIFAGDSQLSDANPTFGQGVKGYSRYFGTAYADLVIGNYMSEAVFPALVHQDPRYFRRGIGNRWSRLAYSMGQIFWTHTDSNHSQLNYSELSAMQPQSQFQTHTIQIIEIPPMPLPSLPCNSALIWLRMP